MKERSTGKHCHIMNIIHLMTIYLPRTILSAGDTGRAK